MGGAGGAAAAPVKAERTEGAAGATSNEKRRRVSEGVAGASAAPQAAAAKIPGKQRTTGINARLKREFPDSTAFAAGPADEISGKAPKSSAAKASLQQRSLARALKKARKKE